MLITNFSCGELSPLLAGRQDIREYYAGASHIENWDVIPTGGIRRRCGTKRLGLLSGECRLIPFILNKDTSFIFECVPGKMLVWKNGAKLTGTDGNQVYIKTDYASLSEVKEVQYAQNYNTMIFVQRNHRPLQMVYDFAFNTFSSSPMSFDFSPDTELDDDFDYVKIVTDALLPVKGDFDGQYALFRGKLYKWHDTGSVWTVEGTDPEVDTELFTVAGKYPGCVAFFNNRLFFASTVQSRQMIWASATPDTAGTRYNDFSTYRKYVTVEKVVKDPDLHIFTGTVNKDQSTITGVTQDLTGVTNVTDYYVTGDQIPVGTKVVSVTKDTVTISSPASESGTSVVFSIQKWRYATTATAADYEYTVQNHDMTTSDCSFFFEVASKENDAIKWMCQNRQLIVGTESSEWIIPSGVTALAYQAVLNSNKGSGELQAICADNAVLFFAQGGKGLREYYWNADEGAFKSNNIASLSPQMLEESAASDIDYQMNPFCRIIIVREDGSAAVLLYEKNNGVAAWYRITISGSIRSCAVTRGDDYFDIVYFAVKHGENYYLEKLEDSGTVYLDSWRQYSVSAVAEYSAPAVIFDVTQKKVFTLSETASVAAGDEAYIGYPYASKLTSMPVADSDPTGKKRITALDVRFYNSWMPSMVCSQSIEHFTGAAEPFTGVKKITYPGSSGIDVTFSLEASQCRPCTVLAVNAELES